MHSGRVAIIGAGASGIGSIDQFLQKGFEVVVFEAKDQAGGAWVYDPKPGEVSFSYDPEGRPVLKTEQDSTRPGWGVDPARDPGPMYDGLRTNIPCDLMAYRAQPFPSDVSLFPTYSEVLSYLQSVASKHTDVIRYNTTVVSVFHTVAPDSQTNDKLRRWTIKTISNSNSLSSMQEEKKEKEETFDFIVVANGHYAQPAIPFVKGLWEFTENHDNDKNHNNGGRKKVQVLHSKWYRRPQDFENRKVLVVGNSASGYDIAREIAIYNQSLRQKSGAQPSEGGTSKPVIQAIRSADSPLWVDPRLPDAPPWAREIEVVAPIKNITDGGGEGKKGVVISFEDGKTIEGIEIIIFATGFLYSFPFLDPSLRPFCEYPPITIKPPVPSDARPENAIETQAYPTGGVRVHGLDRFQLFWRHDPTLAFSCLNYMVIPFVLAQHQARYLSRVWASFPLPPLSTPNSSLPPYPIQQVSSPPVTPPENSGSIAQGESRRYHILGYPKEFEWQNEFLKEIGEGGTGPLGLDAKSPRDIGLEANGGIQEGEPGKSGRRDVVISDGGENFEWDGISADGRWWDIPQWRYMRRANGKVLRKMQLGY